MAKFQVSVVQHREFSIVVDAIHEHDALVRAETRVRELRPDEYLGDRPFDLEAVEAVLLSDSDTAGAAASGLSPSRDGRSSERPMAPRPSVSSPDAGGARLPEIARRFGLAATVIALFLLPASRAHATNDGRAANDVYVGPSFTTVEGVDVGTRITDLGGKLLILLPYTTFLEVGGYSANEIRITQSDISGVYMTDGVNRTPAVPAYFTLLAFLNPTDTDIDWSQGWSLEIRWNCNADGCENQFQSVYAGTGEAFGETIDQTETYNASGVLVGYANTGNGNPANPTGTWTDPQVWIVNGAVVPEPSTWAMLLVGFSGLALWRARLLAPRPALVEARTGRRS